MNPIELILWSPSGAQGAAAHGSEELADLS